MYISKPQNFSGLLCTQRLPMRVPVQAFVYVCKIRERETDRCILEDDFRILVKIRRIPRQLNKVMNIM